MIAKSPWDLRLPVLVVGTPAMTIAVGIVVLSHTRPHAQTTAVIGTTDTLPPPTTECCVPTSGRRATWLWPLRPRQWVSIASPPSAIECPMFKPTPPLPPSTAVSSDPAPRPALSKATSFTARDGLEKRTELRSGGRTRRALCPAAPSGCFPLLAHVSQPSGCQGHQLPPHPPPQHPLPCQIFQL